MLPNAADIFFLSTRYIKTQVDRLNYDRYCRLFVSVQYTCFKARIAVLRNPINKPCKDIKNYIILDSFEPTLPWKVSDAQTPGEKKHR